jgi:hypothetical protein
MTTRGTTRETITEPTGRRCAICGETQGPFELTPNGATCLSHRPMLGMLALPTRRAHRA